MTEIPHYSDPPFDESVLHNWFQREIAGRGFCPPLANLIRQYSDETANVDWKTLGEMIEVQSYMTMNPQDSKLIPAVARQYVRFVTNASQDRGPLTTVAILPWFSTNKAFDDFSQNMYDSAKSNMLANTGGWKAIHTIYKELFESTINSKDRLLNYSEVRMSITDQVLRNNFTLVYFYGRPLTDADLLGFNQDRGDMQRQKVLSRAPYYILQVVNPLKGREIIGSLNRKKLWQVNTKKALELQPRFEHSIKNLFNE